MGELDEKVLLSLSVLGAGSPQLTKAADGEIDFKNDRPGDDGTLRRVIFGSIVKNHHHHHHHHQFHHHHKKTLQME